MTASGVRLLHFSERLAATALQICTFGLIPAMVVMTSVAQAQEAPEGIAGQFGDAVLAGASAGATGAMTYSISFDLPAARGDAQPDLNLTYRSDRATAEAGEGWALEVLSIERARLSGWPKYKDFGTPESEDRYAYGGRPLTFICVVGASGLGSAQCPAEPAVGPMPSWASGYRHYRVQVEGSFERFFLSPARDRWIVQKRGGTLLEFGEAQTQPALSGPSRDDDEITGKTFRWNLVRAVDRHLKKNLIVYRWTQFQGRSYLTDIFYTPSALHPSAGVDEFAYHVQLSWEKPAYAHHSYTHADKRRHQMRLKRVAVAGKSWSGVGARKFLRAYRLEYFADRSVAGAAGEAPVWGRSYLREVRMEGRCLAAEVNGSIPAITNCPTLPATSFEYQPAEIAAGVAIRSPLSNNLPYVYNTGIYDINRDGLPDIIQSWPQNFDDPGAVATFYNECASTQSGTINHWYWLLRPTNTPYLVCRGNSSEDVTGLRSAREQMAYVNRMGSPGGPVAMQHHCLDAGDGSLRTLTYWQVADPHNISPGALPGSPVALFSQWGAEAAGPWGDALFLWSKAGWRGFQIEPANAAYEFCPQVRGPNPPLSYPSLRWRESDDSLWAKMLRASPQTPSGGVMTDVDGDGVLDRIGQSPQTSNGFARGVVSLSRRISKLENVDGFQGPALLPFTFTPEAEDSLIAASAQLANYVDMDGDGLVDLVTWNGDDIIHVRPGDGRGHFGCTAATDASCNEAGNGSWLGDAYKLTINPPTPFPLWTRGPGDSPLVARDSYFHDVTGDGLADLIVFEPSNGPQDPGATTPHARISLWINVDGHSLLCAAPLTGCVVATIAEPDQPQGSHLAYRVTFVDFDANGTTDILVLGSQAVWYYSFVKPLSGDRATRPGLLTRIRNGVGADVEIEYKTIQQLDHAAAQTADPVGFIRPWRFHSPVVVPVVTRIWTRDTSQVMSVGLSEPFQISREVRFAYRNPAYDLWERSFKGFRRVRRILPANEVAQTWYWFGPCEEGTVSVRCPNGSDDAPDKGWTGLPVRVDRFVEGGGPERPEQWLSTVTYTYGRPWIEPPPPNADRNVVFPAMLRRDEYLYDTSRPVSHSDDTDLLEPGALQSAPLQDERVHLVTEFTYDSAGNARSTREIGRVEPVLAPANRDRPITTLSLPESGSRCAADWRCLDTGFKVIEGDSPEQRTLRDVRFTRDNVGDVTKEEGYLSYPGLAMSNTGLSRNALGSSGPPSASTQSGWRTVQVIAHDVFGNVIRLLGPPGVAQSCIQFDFDGPYRQLPQKMMAYKEGGCSGVPLTYQYMFDRPLQSMTVNTEPNGSVTKLVHDAFGRLKEFHTPAPDLAPPATELAIKLTHVTKAPTPYVIVDRRVDVDKYIRSIEIFNGIGEPVLGFDQADGTADGAPWVLRDWTEHDSDGRIHVTYRPWFFSGNALSVADNAPVLASASTAVTTSYDPFGRALKLTDDTTPVAAFTYRPLETEFRDAEQMKSTGPYAGFFSSTMLDGHGRLRESRSRNNIGLIATVFDYLGTGEVTKIRRRLEGTAAGGDEYVRTLFWDSFGRLFRNDEPNTSAWRTAMQSGSPVESFQTWLYVYDDASRLVGTSDARGCGKDIYYDALERVVAEDYSPCEPGQPAYTPPNLTTGDGTEVRYVYDTYEPGQLATSPSFPDNARNAMGAIVAIRDRGAHTRFNYDARGRLRQESRRVARPGSPSSLMASRYADNWFSRELSYDLGDRIRRRDTGLRSDEILEAGQSYDAFKYTARGLVESVGSAYGTLLRDLRYTPDGSIKRYRFGDAAGTLTDFAYDTHDRLTMLRTYRSAAPVWSAPTAVYPAPTADTTQLDLTFLKFTYDDVDNPVRIDDISTGVWRAGSRTVSREMEYDGLYGLSRISYLHGSDEHVPPFTPEADALDQHPVPERRGNRRLGSQKFAYDFLNNVVTGDDNEHLRFDWSIGRTLYGRPTTHGVEGPNQMVEADGIKAQYDDAGNLRELTVSRPWCSPRMPNCSHRFLFDWDEVGQLMRARRWDFPAGAVPPFIAVAVPAWSLAYAYSGPRALTTYTDSAANERHTLDVFDTLRVSRASYDASTTRYKVNVENEVGFVGDIGRVFVDRAGTMPRAAGIRRHVFLNLEDQLGSTTFVLDKDSGEVVERAAYQAFGAIESDFRPERWVSNREEYKFTGKEEDIEVGLTYFGARYYQAHLGRWLSPDPLTIHGVSGSLNPYAYVDGRVLTDIDPSGLENIPANAERLANGYWIAWVNGQWEFYDPPTPAEPSPEAREHPRVGESAGRDSSSSGISQVAKLPSTQIPLVGGYYIVPTHVWKATVNEAQDAVDSFNLWTNPYMGLARATGLTKAPAKAFQNVTGGDDKDLSEHSATVGVMIATMAIGPGGGPSKVASKVPDRVGRTLQILKAALKPAGKPHGHHSIPKYLGGPVVQKELAKLAANQHQAFHSGLQYIFPTTGKARSGVAYSTAYYRSLKPATLRQIHNQMAVYTRAFDAKYGTKIWDVMVRNGFPIIP